MGFIIKYYFTIIILALFIHHIKKQIKIDAFLVKTLFICQLIEDLLTSST